MEILAIYLVAGALAGLASGLFGIGGGLIIVPALLFVFDLQGVEQAVAVHLAVGTSLATIILTALSSIRAHWQLDNILWPVFRALAMGMAVGAFVGAQIAGALPGELLRRIFAVFMLTLALRMAFQSQPTPQRRVPGPLGLGGVGLTIGALSSLVGIGGGSMTVPYLAWCGVAMRRAVGTSAAGGLAIAIAGSLGFVVAGSTRALPLPPWSTGFVYWPAALGIVASSVFAAPFGARLASRLPQRYLQRAFAVFLIIVGLYLLLG